MNAGATFWRVYTHDWRPPVQGGDPVCDGTLPVTLPPVALDTGNAECAAGYHACREPVTALRIGGLWPNGSPSRLVAVTMGADVIHRGDKSRASTLTIEREASDDEWRTALMALHTPFGKIAGDVTAETLAWRAALARPAHGVEQVEAGLRVALEARGLAGWTLRAYACARDAWAARDARDAWAARDARDAWAARDARDAWAAWDARDAWAARDARDAWAAWDARAAWDAWDAWAALTQYVAARNGWVQTAPDLLTAGLRDAYTHGLAVALPVAKNTLGYAMVRKDGAA
jgi:hypothetical protein